MEININELLKNLLNEKNIVYLIGAGASTPFFSSLGDFEKIMTDSSLSETSKNLVKILFFEKSVSKNSKLFKYMYDRESLDPESIVEIENISYEYTRFIHSNIEYLKTRNSRVSPRRLSVLTTNYDLFFEIGMDNLLKENTRLFFNDGMNGYAVRRFDIDNFNKSLSYTGVFDEYSQEMPVINLIKCHGSANWIEKKDNNIPYLSSTSDRKLLEKISEKIFSLKSKVDAEIFTKTDFDCMDLESMIKNLNEYSPLLDEISDELNNEINSITTLMKQIQIVYPTKQKFEATLINQNYYSMLRYLSYELEKEETVLIAFGFSFYDEHITDIVKRSLNNPRLIVLIICYKESNYDDILKEFKFTVSAKLN